MLIQELVLQLVSDDTVGAWPRWADGRDELAITVEAWEHVGMSSKEPLSAAFSLWDHNAPCHTGFDSVMWSPLTGSIRQRFWFVALSKQTLCKCGCGGRRTLEPRNGASTTCSEAAGQQGGMTEDPAMHQFGGERLAVAGRYRLQFRGDWPWLSGTLGLVSHASGSSA